MKRSTLNKILLWSLVLLVMAVIYGLSAQTSAESKALSGKSIRIVAAFMVPFDSMISARGSKRSLVREWQSLVRKAAHLIIYMLLSGQLLGIAAARNREAMSGCRGSGYLRSVCCQR